MALSIATLLDNAAADIHASELHKFRGMAGVALVVIANNAWSLPGERLEQKALRGVLETFATQRAGIPLPTWQAYAKGLDTMAEKIAANMAGAEFAFGGVDYEFDGIRDLDETTAVTAMVALFASYGVTSGGQIRDWAKQDGFAPFDAELVKRQRKAAAEAAKAKANEDALNLLLSRRTTDSSTLANQDLVPATPADPLAFLGTMDPAALLALIDAANARLAELNAMATLPESEPPLTQDHVDDEVATPNKPRRQRAVKLADLAKVA